MPYLKFQIIKSNELKRSDDITVIRYHDNKFLQILKKYTSESTYVIKKQCYKVM